MIPSLLNLAIGGGALVRGVPALRLVLLGFMPSGKAVPPFDRAWIALVLTAQTFVGARLGVAAQSPLAISIIGCVLPWLGLHSLDVARDIADFNRRERAWALIIGWNAATGFAPPRVTGRASAEWICLKDLVKKAAPSHAV